MPAAVAGGRLFYWQGGLMRGEWRPVLCSGAELATKRAELERAGYVTRLRLETAPTGFPDAHELREVLRVR